MQAFFLRKNFLYLDSVIFDGSINELIYDKTFFQLYFLDSFSLPNIL